jgi:hypothetical protein
VKNARVRRTFRQRQSVDGVDLAMASQSHPGRRQGNSLLVALALVLLAPSVGAAKRVDWADPALQHPVVDLGADAEVVQWDVRVVDGVVAQGFSRDVEEYRAIKVYTDRGAQVQSQANLPYPDGMTIDYLEVRCTSPDGKSRPVSPEKVFDRILLSLGRRTLKSRSFALPGVRAGTLIEYWTRTSSVNPRSVEDLWLPCQLDVPVRSFQLRVRPWVERTFLLRWNQTVARIEPGGRDTEGYLRMGVQGIPAYRSESDMPSEAESRFTLHGRYGGTPGEDPQTLRSRLTAEMTANFRTWWQSRDSVPAIAARVVGDATSPQVKAARLFEYCRRALKNTSAAAETAAASGLPRMGIEQTVQFVLDGRAGDAFGINMVFGTLARGAGLSAHPALLLAPEAAAFDTSVIVADFARMVVAIRAEDGLHY